MPSKTLTMTVVILMLVTTSPGLLGGPTGPSAVAFAQSAQPGAQAPADRPRLDTPDPADDPTLGNLYRQFYYTYRLAADDEIAVRIVGQPDYSSEKIKVSPLGRIYHPLIGDVDVAGLTIPELAERLTIQFKEYIKAPTVSVDLVVANSAKVGVLGEVGKPGILIMTRPMTVLDVISESGGFTDFGSKADVTVLRSSRNGQFHAIKVNVKKIMKGKANPQENIPILAGDTVIVDGNMKKALATITQIAGFGTFLNFVRFGRRY